MLLVAVPEVDGQVRVIRKEAVVNASIEEVWKSWTTGKEAITWLAPRVDIDATLGGPYETYYLLDQPYGLRGGEGCRIHSLVPMKFLAFTWRSPPGFGVVRDLYTLVFLRFEELGPGEVKVHFTQLGWGEGEEWDRAYKYFAEAWDIVLGRLQHRFVHGPIEWGNRPRPTASLAAKGTGFRRRTLEKQVTIDAPLNKVWEAWTTNEGASTFFAPRSNIDATLGGPYEIYFSPDKSYGERGAEGNRVQSIVPMKSITFTWNAPQQFGILRSLHTYVSLRFEEIGPHTTNIYLNQFGWGEGEDWDKLYEYFNPAWDLVLGRLKYRFAHGPVDWKNPPRPTESLNAKPKEQTRDGIARAAPGGAGKPARESVEGLIRLIRAADYEGDRKALYQLYGELGPFLRNEELESRVRYWRGFALWRRSLNGFNLDVDSGAIEQDLELAVTEFDGAVEKDPAFVDAKIATASCLMSLAYIHRGDPGRREALVKRFVPLLNEALRIAPDNPRVLWVAGSSRWWTPPERGGGQARAMETYLHGLQAARKQKQSEPDPIEPSWGEAELLMSLAWANLNRDTPDLKAAEEYAQAALERVPYWSYVKAILLPQIREARDSQKEVDDGTR